MINIELIQRDPKRSCVLWLMYVLILEPALSQSASTINVKCCPRAVTQIVFSVKIKVLNLGLLYSSIIILDHNNWPHNIDQFLRNILFRVQKSILIKREWNINVIMPVPGSTVTSVSRNKTCPSPSFDARSLKNGESNISYLNVICAKSPQANPT